MRYIKSILEFKIDHTEYAKSQFNSVMANNEIIGKINHSTSIENALKILEIGEIKTGNESYKINGEKDKLPWWLRIPDEDNPGTFISDENYGDFIYTSKMHPYKINTYYGMKEPDVVFTINGNLLKKIRTVYRCLDKKIEGQLYMVKDNIPVSMVSKISYDPNKVVGDNLEKLHEYTSKYKIRLIRK